MRRTRRLDAALPAAAIPPQRRRRAVAWRTSRRRRSAVNGDLELDRTHPPRDRFLRLDPLSQARRHRDELARERPDLERAPRHIASALVSRPPLRRSAHRRLRAGQRICQRAGRGRAQTAVKTIVPPRTEPGPAISHRCGPESRRQVSRCKQLRRCCRLWGWEPRRTGGKVDPRRGRTSWQGGRRGPTSRAERRCHWRRGRSRSRTSRPGGPRSRRRHLSAGLCLVALARGVSSATLRPSITSPASTARVAASRWTWSSVWLRSSAGAGKQPERNFEDHQDQEDEAYIGGDQAIPHPGPSRIRPAERCCGGVAKSEPDAANRLDPLRVAELAPQ